MLFFVGGFFILLGIIRMIMILVNSGRPKADVTVKDIVFMKLKTDMFGIGGDQPHAKVNFNVNGTDYETEVLLNKKHTLKNGDTIKISYPPANPKNAKLSNPSMEWKLAAMLLIMGIVVCGISVAITMAIS